MNTLANTIKSRFQTLISVKGHLKPREYRQCFLLIILILIMSLIAIIFGLGQGLMWFMMQNQADESIWSISLFLLFYISLFTVVLFFFVAMITTSIQRLNDLQQSAWWALMWLAPFLNLVFFVYLLFVPSKSRYI